MMSSNIRHFSISAIALFICVALLSCSDDNQSARTPVAAVTVDKTALLINESMQITFTGVADQVVVYTGDESHDYALRQEANTGFVANKGIFTYAYSVPGTFHVVVVASTYDTHLGENHQTDTYEFDVTVTDNVTTIDRIYSNITPNVYYAELIGESDWVLRLPTKQVYNKREIALNATRQRLTFDIASDSTKIYVDGQLHETRNFYNLTLPHAIDVKAYSGDTRAYMLHVLVYPEFKTVKVGGTAAKLERDAYYQDLLIYKTSAADAANAQLDYTVDENIVFLANGQPLPSGSIIDLTADDGTTYTLRRTLPDRPDIYADTRVRFINE